MAGLGAECELRPFPLTLTIILTISLALFSAFRTLVSVALDAQFAFYRMIGSAIGCRYSRGKLIGL